MPRKPRRPPREPPLSTAEKMLAPFARLAPISNRFKETPLAEIATVIEQGGFGPPPLFDWGGYPWRPTRTSVDANRLGLRTPDLPAWITPEEAVATARAWTRAEYDRVGDAARAVIRDALADTGISYSDRWMYMVSGYTRHHGRNILTILAYQPYRNWPLPHDDLGNVLARDLKIRLPEDWRFAGDSYADYKVYLFDMVGIALHSRQELERLPERVATGIDEPPFAPDGTPFWLAAYRVRAFHAESSVVGIATWRPGQSAVSTTFKGGTLGAPDESHIARRGLELFYAIQHHRPGMSDKEAFEEAVRFCLEWVQDTPGSTPANFGRPQLTAKRVTGPDATKAWLRDKHFGIREVRQEAERRLRLQSRGDRYP